ncbi:MAG TPA: CHAT domain-containing protein [Gemmataceae bacterium]|nr:CHAT domain-containing protein [Gemmataceae bacterium]
MSGAVGVAIQTVVFHVRGDPQQGYRVALSVDGGPAEEGGAFPAPDPAEVAEMRRLVLGPQQVNPRLKTIGRTLWRWLAGTAAAGRWRELRLAAAHTLLDLEDAPDLRGLPWELLEDEEDEGFFRCPDAPVSRGRVLAGGRAKLEPWPDRGPIKVLLAVGSDPGDADVLAGAELRCLTDAVHDLQGLIHVERLDRPSREALSDAFRNYRPHVFHFIGHGGQAGGESFLPFKNPAAPWTWTSRYIQDCLGVCLPWLVILNACRTGQAAAPAADAGPRAAAASRSVAETFLRQRVPAVLAMQGDVRGDAAARLSAPLYQALVRGEPLDAALAEARRQVGNSLGLDRPDWCLPCLWLTVPPSCVPPEGQRGRFRLHQNVRNEFSELRTFVDREPERRTLCFGAEPIDARERPGRRLFVVAGDEQVGKTWLVRWCMQAWRVWGWRLVYLGGDEPGSPFLDLLGLLRRVRDACRDLAGADFSRFNHELTHLDDLARGRPAPPLPAGTVEEPAESPWREEHARAVPQLLVSFRRALESLAGGGPLALVLDPLRLRPDHFSAFLQPHLLRAVARDADSPLRLVLVVPPGDRQGLRLEPDVEELAHRLRVPRFRRADFVTYAEDFWRRQLPDLEKVRQLIQCSAQHLGDEWDPLVLVRMREFYQVLRGQI